jgi:surface protein
MTKVQSRFAKPDLGWEETSTMSKDSKKPVDDYMAPCVVLDNTEIVYPNDPYLPAKFWGVRQLHFVNKFPLTLRIMMAIPRRYEVKITGSAVLPPSCRRGFQYLKFAEGSSLAEFDASGVQDASQMFSTIRCFGSLEIDNWDVSAITNMDGMFKYAKYFDGDLSGWDVSAVTNMYGMFMGATSFNGDLSGWDVSAVIVTGLYGMFKGATSMEEHHKPKGPADFA